MIALVAAIGWVALAASAGAMPMSSGAASHAAEPAQLYVPLVLRQLGQPFSSPTPTVPVPSATTTATAPSTETVVPEPSATATASPTAENAPTPADPRLDALVPMGATRGGQTSVVYDKVYKTYRLTYRGETSIRYELEVMHPDNVLGRLAIREARSGRYPVAGAGLYYRRRSGALVEPRFVGAYGSIDRVEDAPITDGVALTVYETLEGVRHAKRYEVTLVGRSLRIHALSLDGASDANGAYAGFTCGDLEGTTDGESIRIPYMDSVPVTMLDHRWFASTLVDYPASPAGALLPRGPVAMPSSFANEVATLYPPDESGRVRPVDETVWVTLSPEVTDSFVIPRQGGATRSRPMPGALHVSLVGAVGKRFADEASYVRHLAELGMSDIVVHERRWRDPASLLPVQGPPNPASGGESDLRALLAAAPGIVSLTNAYTLTDEPCPGETNPLYVPTDRVTGDDGRPVQLPEENGGRRPCASGVTAGRFLLAPDATAWVAADQLPALRALGVGGVTLGSEAAYNPAYPFPGAAASVLDRASASRHAVTIGQAIASYKELLATARRQAGTVFATGASGLWEWGYDSFYAGYLDASARPLSTGSLGSTPGSAYLVVPDYELSVVHGLMAGFGVGDYSQFFGPYVDTSTGQPLALDEEQIDEYRATELSYGHAGAWQSTAAPLSDQPSYLTTAQEVKEYYLMRPLQQRYLGAAMTSVAYVTAEGAELDLSDALRRDLDLVGPRLHLRYEGGLQLWVNHSGKVWTVSSGDTLYDLPQNGWLAIDPYGLLAFSAMLDGRRVDYLVSDECLLLDGRGETVTVNGTTTTYLRVQLADGRVLAARPDGNVDVTGP